MRESALPRGGLPWGWLRSTGTASRTSESVLVPRWFFSMVTWGMARRPGGRSSASCLMTSRSSRGMRPGRYIATAVEDLEQGRQFAPEFQEQLRRSAREFSVREGETVTLDLKLTTGL